MGMNKAEKFVVEAIGNTTNPYERSYKAWHACIHKFEDVGKKIPPEYSKAADKFAPYNGEIINP